MKTADTTGAVPVIAIDGPSSSGKGTIAQIAATRLGYHYLDSGALYRLTGLATVKAGGNCSVETDAAKAAETLDCRFEGGCVYLAGEDVSDEIRTEQAGINASLVAAHGAVRTALVALQKRFRKAPGLVADGRDMGTVIFPDAELKVFLTASAEVRAQRRYNQLKEKGILANIDVLRKDLIERDNRDTKRAVAPLAPAGDAKLLDSSGMTIDETVAAVLKWYGEIQK